ncbi:hypothetical protein BOTCAL_0298g00150 [Botryotinia calthae]|uniref:Peptidase S8/S53 domain-containing protein n=1 Tax=Botryotinia calthae TaxID=38488 RepID=A0A4Y8CV45_9HELO|nr:hypothetical protein BOTCAL_0298g00150 [Botryotinia calthae]
MSNPSRTYSTDLGPISGEGESLDSIPGNVEEYGESEKEGEDEANSDEYDTEDEVQKAQNLDDGFKEAKEYLVSNSASLSQTKEKQDEFLKEFVRYLVPSELNQEHNNSMPGNILIWLIDNNPQVHSWLIKHLVENHSDLLRDPGSYAQANPLQVAIKSNCPSFVEAVLESDIKDEDLKQILALEDETSKNCIHLAVLSPLDLDLIKKLIDKASENSLTAKDNKFGATPLHYAVDFKISRPGRLEITKALIKNGDKAFGVEMGSEVATRNENKKYSVYQQLVETFKSSPANIRQNKRRSYKSTPAKITNASKAKEPSSRLEASLNLKKEKILPEKNKNETEEDRNYEDLVRQKEEQLKQKKGQTDPSQVNSSKVRDPPGPLRLQGSVPIQTLKRSLTTEKPLTNDKPPPSPLLALSPPSSTKVQEAVSKSQTVKKSGVSTRSQLKESEARLKEYEAIAHELKLHYLRSIFQEGSLRSHDSAIKFLYGDNPNDINICFEFPPIGQRVTEKIIFEDFQRNYQKFSFDKVLQSVHFGEIQLDAPKVSRRRPERTFKPGNGRRDIVDFFNWLKVDKKVTHIVMVTVDDMTDPPNSDQALEDSLKDPKAIQDACETSNLREIHLYWSGNNSILRAWSEPDGLVKMENLETIYVYASKGLLESQDRVERNYNEFQKRITEAKGKRAIIVKDLRYDTSDSNTTYEGTGMHSVYSKNAGQTQIDPHRWLTVMDSFVKAICKLNPPQKLSPGEQGKPDQGRLYLKDEKLPPALRKDIQVALIDDGADFMHKAIADKLDGGRSFDSSKGIPVPYHGSTTGHGTYMAYMIRRICPQVKIYVCKLNVMRGGDGTARFTAESAADAVEFAVKRGFDIISISWTVQKGDNKNIKRLSEAIANATKKNILVFCSAPDIGHANSAQLETYHPFGDPANKSQLFRIGAAKADGSAYSWLGSADSVDFILPGDNVKLLSEDSIKEEDDIPKTGSSVATALAAGFAGLIIHCVRLAAIYHWNMKGNIQYVPIDEESLKDIKTIGKMKAAFQIITDKTGNDRRLEVEPFFKSRTEKLQENSDAWDVIVSIANALLPNNYERGRKS